MVEGSHRVTALTVRAAGLARLFPEAGDPWQPNALHLATHPHSAAEEVGARLGREGIPTGAFHVSDDAWITTKVDVGPWLHQKPTAILAHRSEVERGASPGRIAALPPDVQRRILGTEWYIPPGSRTPRRGADGTAGLRRSGAAGPRGTIRAPAAVRARQNSSGWFRSCRSASRTSSSGASGASSGWRCAHFAAYGHSGTTGTPSRAAMA